MPRDFTVMWNLKKKNLMKEQTKSRNRPTDAKNKGMVARRQTDGGMGKMGGGKWQTRACSYGLSHGDVRHSI